VTTPTNPRAEEYDRWWLAAVDTEEGTRYLTMETIFAPEFSLTDNPERAYSWGDPIDPKEVAEGYVARMNAQQ
jgi:hypothetical protein